jgi:hypothetical protein
MLAIETLRFAGKYGRLCRVGLREQGKRHARPDQRAGPRLLTGLLTRVFPRDKLGPTFSMAGSTEWSDSVDSVEQQAELDALLRSTFFAHAPNQRKILAYICGRHLDGQASLIKEYSIAVDALGRDTDFDPSRNSIVRDSRDSAPRLGPSRPRGWSRRVPRASGVLAQSRAVQWPRDPLLAPPCRRPLRPWNPPCGQAPTQPRM